MSSRLKIACTAALLCISIPALAEMDGHDGKSAGPGWRSEQHECGGHHHFGHDEERQVTPEQMHEHLKARIDQLSERLEIKSSQLATWEEYAKSVEMLADQHVTKPGDDADAATLSHYRAERAAEFAKKLARIADATSKLQAVLTDEQKKIFNQMSHHFHHDRGHEWKSHMETDREGSHDAHGMNQ